MIVFLTSHWFTIFPDYNNSSPKKSRALFGRSVAHRCIWFIIFDTGMKKTLWNLRRLVRHGMMWLLLMWMCTFCFESANAQTAIWKTTLNSKGCGVATSVEEAYDIDFGTFNGSDVFTWTKTNNGFITSGAATSHTSNVPSITTTGYYLVVVDRCATSSWHADLLASSMSDQNTTNTVTATAIPANNLKLQANGIAYFLDTSPSNSEVSANSVGTDTSFGSSPLQLLQRTAWTNPVWWRYGVSPSYKLIIPQYQQMDTYKGTITRTVL